MPILDKPSNDANRLNMLNMTVSTGTSDLAAGNNYLSEETLNEVAAKALEFNTELLSGTGSAGDRSKEVREKNEAVKKLETFTRDMWEVIKRRVFRNNEPAEVLSYYQLPLDGTVPKVIKEDEIFTLAAKVIEGDSKAVGAGYSMAVCPSAAELGTILAAAQKEANDVAQADRQLDKAYKDMAVVREQADEIIDDIIAELEYNLRKLEPSNRRRVMRTYGVSFKYAPGEPVDPAEQAK